MESQEWSIWFLYFFVAESSHLGISSYFTAFAPRCNFPQIWRSLCSRRGNTVNRTTRRLRYRILSVLVVCLIAFEFAIAGQTDTGLKILVVKGNEAETVVSRLARPITVRVVDDNDRPVSDATVVFTAPDGSPSSDFVDGFKSVIVFTDRQGLAATPQYRASSTAGAYLIQVHAAFMNQVATVSIAQTNIVAKKSSRGLVVIAAVAGGVLAAAFAGKSAAGGEPAPTPPLVPAPPTIVFAGSSVGGPR